MLTFFLLTIKAIRTYTYMHTVCAFMYVVCISTLVVPVPDVFLKFAIPPYPCLNILVSRTSTSASHFIYHNYRWF